MGLVLAILYISLFFSHEDQTTDRVTTAVTVLLTAAVLLGAIYASLPEVGYTVAIEYGFYLFFALALAAVFLALIGSRLYKSGNEEVLTKLDLGARIAFPLIVLVSLGGMWCSLGRGWRSEGGGDDLLTSIFMRPRVY